MKKAVFISLITIVLLSFTNPGDLHWYSLKDGMELARKENKPVFLFVYVSWCDKCQRMDKKVFPNNLVRPLIEENFVPIRLNPETDTAYIRNDKLIDKKIFLREVSEGKFMLGVPRIVMFNERSNEKLAFDGLQAPEELKGNILEFLKK
jgi:thioredoxin-related protein